MSTMIALLLVLSTLAGCASETLVNVKTAHAPPPPALVYSVEIEEFEDVFRDEDGTELAVCSYALPVLQAAREDGTPLEGEQVPEAVQAFNDQFSSWRNNAQALVQQELEDKREELERRRGKLSPPQKEIPKGYLRRYAALVGPVAFGAALADRKGGDEWNLQCSKTPGRASGL